MSDPSGVEAATRRLSLALDALEAAVERRGEADRGEEALSAQLHHFGNDRAKLAAELDEALAQARRLEDVNREVAQRLDLAMETIRSVIDAHEQK